jgi:hypothetical protein
MWLMQGSIKVIVILSVTIFLSSLLFWPGIMSPDSIHQLAEARSSMFTTAHPPSMAMLWGFLDRVIAGPAGMLLLHLLVFWVGWGLWVRGLSRLLGFSLLSLGGRILWLLPLWPPFYYQFSTVWKDLGMIAFATFGAGAFVYWRASVSRPKALLLLSGLAFVYALSVRHNAIGLVGPMVCGSVFVAWPKRSIWALASSALGVLMVWFGVQTVFGIVAVNTTGAAIARLQAWDLIGVSVREKKNLLDGLPVVASAVSLDEVYHQRCIDFMYPRGLDFEGVASQGLAVSARWKEALLSHPLSYLSHRWGVMASHLGLTSAPAHVPAWPPSAEHSEALHRFYLAMLFLEEHTPLFKPYIYILISLVAGLWAAWPKTLLFFTMGAHMSIVLSLLPVMPCADFRYGLGHLLIALLSVSGAMMKSFKTPRID